MESVMPGGLSGVLGGDGGGALPDLELPNFGGKSADEKTEPMSPIPLGF